MPTVAQAGPLMARCIRCHIKESGVMAATAMQHTMYLVNEHLHIYMLPERRFQQKKKKNFTSFGQPTRLITCANHGNNVTCS